MSENEGLGDTEPRGISRRTVAIGAAWAVPVIALATASPAFAASNGIISLSGTGCKLPGNSQSVYKGYVFNMTASNTTNSPVTVTITSATLNGTNLGGVTIINLDGCVALGNPFTIPANTTLTHLALLTKNATNSQNGTLVVSYTVAGDTGTQEASANASGLGPIQGSCNAFTSAQATCIESQ
jgi:hypothetical protein